MRVVGLQQQRACYFARVSGPRYPPRISHRCRALVAHPSDLTPRVTPRAPPAFPSFPRQMEDKLDAIARGEKGRVEYLSEYYLGEEGLKAKVARKRETIDPVEAKRARLPGLEVRHDVAPLSCTACCNREVLGYGGLAPPGERRGKFGKLVGGACGGGCMWPSVVVVLAKGLSGIVRDKTTQGQRFCMIERRTRTGRAFCFGLLKGVTKRRLGGNGDFLRRASPL